MLLQSAHQIVIITVNNDLILAENLCFKQYFMKNKHVIPNYNYF